MPLENKNGVASLIYIEDVSEPLVRPCFGRDVVLADKGFYWLEIGLEGENYWLTAAYDKDLNYIQYYFDITRQNHILGEKSYFEDMFLDVIFQNKGEVAILDDDELKKAREEGIISNKEFDLAHSVADKIIEDVLKNREEYDKICLHYLSLLRKKLLGV